MMHTDTSQLLTSTPADDAVPTIIVQVNQPAADTGIRVPVERVTVEELFRRQQQDAAQRAAADQRLAANPTAPLPNNVAVLQAMVLELRDVVAQRDQRVAALELAMDALIRRCQRLPRNDWPANQPALFPEAHPEAAPLSDTATTTAPAPTAPPPAAEATPATESAGANQKGKKKGHGRRSLAELLENAPLDRREHRLTEAERLCPCCGRLRQIVAEQTSQQLEYIPAQFRRIEHVQFTYSCPSCPEHIQTAPKPPQPIERGLAGPGLLALVTASKFEDYVPLYRQELIHARAGLFLARSTLCDWLMALGELVQPLVALMKQDIFRSRVVQTDGTAIAVLVEGERQTRTGYFWPCLGDDAHPQVVVDFSLDKRKEHPQRFLADYSGYVQVDAYSAYDGCFVFNSDTVHPKIEVGCWSHAERYFEVARDSHAILAAEALGFIRALFAIEAQAKRGHLAEAEVLALRQREAVPILDTFKTWLDQTRPQVLPKSPLADAVRYTLNQWEALRRYADTGFLSMDNNATELINKMIARGRVNWLFVGSPRGGVTAARLLSLVLTCRRLEMDSLLYLQDVFTRLPSLPAERLAELLPNRWLESHPEARHPPERQGHGHGDRRPRRRHWT